MSDKPANERLYTGAERPRVASRPWERPAQDAVERPTQLIAQEDEAAPGAASSSVTSPSTASPSRGSASSASSSSSPPTASSPATRDRVDRSAHGTVSIHDSTTSFPDMLRPRNPRPRSGWRALAYQATRGRWNPGISTREQGERDREEQIATQLKGRHVTAFFCLKGGISKTSTTAATSIALSDLRPDPVFAIDANPDAGDLAERLVGEKLSGIAALARDISDIDSLERLSFYTATRGRLTVLPGEPNPILGDSLRADDFDAVMRVVQRYYSFIQIDCGTGVTHPLMEGVLRFANTVVIPAAWSITGAKRAAETISWLEENGFERLARTCIVVLTAKDVVSASVDKDAVLAFLSRAADVVIVPADAHVADGALLDWEALAPATREAYLDIAAAITRRFGDPV